MLQLVRVDLLARREIYFIRVSTAKLENQRFIAALSNIGLTTFLKNEVV